MEAPESIGLTGVSVMAPIVMARSVMPAPNRHAKT
jgi:hypothetical protein